MPVPSHAEDTELARLLYLHAEARQQQVRTALESAAPALASAAEMLLAACLQGQRVYLCALADAQALAERAASLLLRGILQPRPGLPVVLLRPLADEGAGCSQQIGSLAAAGDVLLLFSTTRSDGLDAFIDAARLHDMRLMFLGGVLAQDKLQCFQDTDLIIQLDTPCPASLHEAGLAAVHALCDALDHRLLGLA